MKKQEKSRRHEATAEFLRQISRAQNTPERALARLKKLLNTNVHDKVEITVLYHSQQE